MDAYQAFTDQLVRTLSDQPTVTGIVALGSMAGQHGRTPDRFSDHDFFVIAEDAEPLRQTTAWLPHPDRIALWFRETAHGCKAIYDDGHLVEYAVFTPDELRLARVNDYRILLDRADIAPRMAALAEVRDAAPAPEFLHGMFLSHVLVAAGRARRGEEFSARWMLSHAMRFLVQLLGGGPDDLDPLRRFHHAALEDAMALGPAAGAGALLDIYERECSGNGRAIAAVRAAL